MNLLIDSHIFVWYINGDSKLTSEIREIIADPTNKVYLSAVSIWELILKYEQGKITLAGPAHEFLVEQRIKHQITSLALDEPSVQLLPTLPTNIKDPQGRDHKDPFDRMMICQALHHGLTFVTIDGAIQKYAVPVLPIV